MKWRIVKAAVVLKHYEGHASVDFTLLNKFPQFILVKIRAERGLVGRDAAHAVRGIWHTLTWPSLCLH